LSTCAGLTTSDGKALPVGSFILTPQYADQDEWSKDHPQGPVPIGASVGTAGSAVASNKSIYKSEAAASNRIIRAFYGLPNNSVVSGFQAIPISQAPGSYIGTVTVTIAVY